MKIGVAETPIAIIALVRLGPRKAASAIARIRNGQASIASTMRRSVRRSSRRRSRREVPSGTPIASAMPTEMSPALQRGAGAPDDAGEHVAADLVGAEPVRSDGGLRTWAIQLVAMGS
jgi:hypothetical protein